MGESVNELRAIAHAYVQSMNYTDARVAELESSLKDVKRQHYSDNRKTLKTRFQLHAALILFGISISVLLLIDAVSPVIMAIITGGPSVITEIIDYIKRF